MNIYQLETVFFQYALWWTRRYTLNSLLRSPWREIIIKLFRGEAIPEMGRRERPFMADRSLGVMKLAPLGSIMLVQSPPPGSAIVSGSSLGLIPGHDSSSNQDNGSYDGKDRNALFHGFTSKHYKVVLDLGYHHLENNI